VGNLSKGNWSNCWKKAALFISTILSWAKNLKGTRVMLRAEKILQMWVVRVWTLEKMDSLLKLWKRNIRWNFIRESFWLKEIQVAKIPRTNWASWQIHLKKLLLSIWHRKLKTSQTKEGFASLRHSITSSKKTAREQLTKGLLNLWGTVMKTYWRRASTTIVPTTINLFNSIITLAPNHKILTTIWIKTTRRWFGLKSLQIVTQGCHQLCQWTD